MCNAVTANPTTRYNGWGNNDTVSLLFQLAGRSRAPHALITRLMTCKDLASTRAQSRRKGQRQLVNLLCGCLELVHLLLLLAELLLALRPMSRRAPTIRSHNNRVRMKTKSVADDITSNRAMHALAHLQPQSTRLLLLELRWMAARHRWWASPNNSDKFIAGKTSGRQMRRSIPPFSGPVKARSALPTRAHGTRTYLPQCPQLRLMLHLLLAELQREAPLQRVRLAQMGRPVTPRPDPAHSWNDNDRHSVNQVARWVNALHVYGTDGVQRVRRPMQENHSQTWRVAAQQKHGGRTHSLFSTARLISLARIVVCDVLITGATMNEWWTDRLLRNKRCHHRSDATTDATTDVTIHRQCHNGLAHLPERARSNNHPAARRCVIGLCYMLA